MFTVKHWTITLLIAWPRFSSMNCGDGRGGIFWGRGIATWLTRTNQIAFCDRNWDVTELMAWERALAALESRHDTAGDSKHSSLNAFPTPEQPVDWWWSAFAQMALMTSTFRAFDIRRKSSNR
jgi:hypothetical protein